MIKKLSIISFLFLSILSITNSICANTMSQASLNLQILSSQTLNGTAGDYVTVNASIKNISVKAVDNITTYLSLVDEETKLPVDLEDWSAEKGLFIGTIDTGQVLPLDWKIHFVKAGRYSLIIVAEIVGEKSAQTSSIVHFVVASKQNLNPGFILPVALGMPLIILFMIMIVTYRRNSRIT
jgi:hypothetical protein